MDSNNYLYINEKKRMLDVIKGQSGNLKSTSEIAQDVDKTFILNCWICENWVDVEYSIDMKLDKIENPVFIHCEWDNYYPWFIKEDNGK